MVFLGACKSVKERIGKKSIEIQISDNLAPDIFTKCYRAFPVGLCARDGLNTNQTINLHAVQKVCKQNCWLKNGDFLLTRDRALNGNCMWKIFGWEMTEFRYYYKLMPLSILIGPVEKTIYIYIIFNYIFRNSDLRLFIAY